MDAPCAAAAGSTALVLGNRDLLDDILFRVDSPTWLVRTALVSKSWLRVVSDPAFLDLFRAVHPPRVLAISIRDFFPPDNMFPVPQPPELAAAARHAGRILGNLGCEVHLPPPSDLAARAARRVGRTLEYLGRQGRFIDYCNGRLLLELTDSFALPEPSFSLEYTSYAIASLLHEDQKIMLPPRPPLRGASRYLPESYHIVSSMFLKEDDGEDAMSCLYVDIKCWTAVVRADFSILRSGVWGVPQSAVMELKQGSVRGHMLLSGEKLYMTTFIGVGLRCIALDLATATFSALELPDGAADCASLVFSRAKQSGLYLICATKFQLRVWHGDGAGQWVLVDTISVREACAQLNVQAWVPDDENSCPVSIAGAGDNAEFVILKLVASKIICCMQLGNRVVEKVAEGVQLNYGSEYVRPISMVWPPYLPVLE